MSSSSSPDARRRVHLRVQGRVQGVSFRYYASREAARLGLAGWVRNAPDGTVEAEAEGDPAAVDRFIAWARSGPPSAEVERAEVEDIQPAGNRSAGFRIVG